MSELLVFDDEMWNTLTSMLSSPDKESRELAYGMIKNIDYNNQEQMKIFEETMLSSMASSSHLGDDQKGKLVYNYFKLLGKQNGNIK
jgi:hypothetical protein